MMRNCNLCHWKVHQNGVFEDGPISFKKTIKVNEQRIISGTAKMISRVVKQDILTKHFAKIFTT